MNYKNPFPTVDAVIEVNSEDIILIKRKNKPHGYALPGGFVEYGESYEEAVKREAKEEVGLDINLIDLLFVYSDPARDERQHNVSTVYVAEAYGQKPEAGDDASSVMVIKAKEAVKLELAFDHKKIIEDYLKYKEMGFKPRPTNK